MVIHFRASFIFLAAFSAVLIFAGCTDETECYHEDKRLCDPNFVARVTGIIPFGENLEGYSEKFLLEEFTGFLCTNCPTATATAKEFRET